jgi:CelD/BcsL family acetyltransferase involved in cellulose biosynthesis
MNIRVVKFENLTNDEIAAWSDIQRSEPSLDSPYFRPEFTQAVAAVRNDVEVAALEEAGLPVGFLPFQRSSWNAGRPVGGALSDFHGLIARSGTTCDPLELLRACGLSTWHFSHLVGGQTWLAPYVWKQADSPYIDLSDGMEAYLAGRQNGRRFMKKYRQKARKLAREVGPLHYEVRPPDCATMATCMTWKSDQYRRTNELDIFKFAWVRNLLGRILECVGDGFSPLVGVLYAGDTVAAINFGMRSRDVFHSWFPAYNFELAKFSPGFLHWIEAMKSARAHGIRRIDLSTGQEAFKTRFGSGASRVAEGAVDLRSTAALLRMTWQSACERLRSTTLGTTARVPAQMVRRFTHWLDLR